MEGNHQHEAGCGVCGYHMVHSARTQGGGGGGEGRQICTKQVLHAESIQPGEEGTTPPPLSSRMMTQSIFALFKRFQLLFVPFKVGCCSLIQRSICRKNDFPSGTRAVLPEIMLTAPLLLGGIAFMMNACRDCIARLEFSQPVDARSR